MRIDDGAVHRQGLHAALDLRDRTHDVLRREHREAGKPIRITPARSGEAVIRQPRKRRALGRLENLHAGRGQQQQLLVDAQLIHPRNALRADVHELLLQRLQFCEHSRHAQRRVVGSVRAFQQADLRLENFRDVPRLLGRDSQVGRVTVDCPPLRRQASSVAISRCLRRCSTFQAARSASATGSRAARSAGKKPPSSPMRQAQTMPVMISARVTVS